MAVSKIENNLPNVSQVSDPQLADELNKIYVQLRLITEAINKIVEEVNSGSEN